MDSKALDVSMQDIGFDKTYETSQTYITLSAPKGQYMLVVQLETKKFTNLIIKK